MRFDKDDLVLAAYVARSSELEPCVIGARLVELKKLSKKHHNAAEVVCSGPADRVEAAERSLVRIEARAQAIAQELGLPMGYSRDPRGGCAFRFKLPGGRSNSFGGEDWLF